MSEDSRASSREDVSGVDEYQEMQKEIRSVVGWIDEKLENGRIRDPERARARQGYLRLKINAIGEWRKLKEAGDLAELQDEVEELKQDRERVRA